MVLAYLSGAWLLGIFSGSLLGSYAVLPVYSLILGAIPLCLVPLLAKHKRQLLLTGFCLFAIIGGALRFQSTAPAINEKQIQFYNDQSAVQIEGMIGNDPEIRGSAVLFHLSAQKLNLNEASRAVEGTALVRTLSYNKYHYGDIVKLVGRLETPKKFDDFDYSGYLANQGIYTIINYPGIELLERDKGFKPLSAIYSLRASLAQSLSSALPEPQNSLAQGIFLGLRGTIPPSFIQALSRTGTTHLLAISGMNLSILIGIFLSAGIWIFGKRHYIYIWSSLLVLWFYTMVTGAPPSVVRSAIMGSLFLIAELLGRQRSAMVALSVAACVMVGLEPPVLWDVSFQLSFLSMLGLIIIFPSLHDLNVKAASITSIKGPAVAVTSVIADSFAITLAALLATWPVITYNFGTFSLVSMPATFFALPSFPYIIIAVGLTSLVGLFYIPVAHVLGWISWLFLSYFQLIIQIFDSLPFAAIRAVDMNLGQVWLYYASLITVMMAIKYRKLVISFATALMLKVSQLTGKTAHFIARVPKKLVVIPLLAANILVWVAVLSMPDDKLHVSILDVGQGDAILIQTPNRQNILIDAGPGTQAVNFALGGKLPFWDKNIDLVILTQPQADHIAGLLELLKSYKVEHIIKPEIPADSATYQHLFNSGSEISDPLTAHVNHYIDLGDEIKLVVLNPPLTQFKGTSDDIDNNGTVLKLSWHNVSFLFTADIREEAERYLIFNRASLQSDVLKIAHHGSKTSTSEEFLNVVDPAVAVISAGRNNNFGHPSPEVTKRLVQRLGKDNVLITSINGSIEFITDGEKLWLKTEKTGQEN